LRVGLIQALAPKEARSQEGKEMNARFWKLSHGAAEFPFEEFLSLLERRVVCVHKDTKAKAISPTAQGENFVNAMSGDYFYLTHGNQGIYVLGQFIGPANIFSSRGAGWVEREYRVIRTSKSRDSYSGEHKWWTPDDNSTFIQVPALEFQLFEQLILKPYFDLELKSYGIGG
jgi:hypothetical protein